MMEMWLLMLVLLAGSDGEEWYRGGTVVDATVADWHRATEADRLASAAELLAVAKAVPSLAELRPRAEALAEFITGARVQRHFRVPVVAALGMDRLGLMDRAEALGRLHARYPPSPPRPSPTPPQVAPSPKRYPVPPYVGRWKSTTPFYGAFQILDFRIDGILVIDHGFHFGQVEMKWWRLGRLCVTSGEGADRAVEFHLLRGGKLLAVDTTGGGLEKYLEFTRVSAAPPAYSTEAPALSTATVPSVCR